MPGTVLSVPELNKKRRKAVQLRLDGRSLAQVSQDSGLSAPTIIAAVKAFRSGGWPAVDVKPRGRPRAGENSTLPSDMAPALITGAINSDKLSLWNTEAVRTWLQQQSGKTITSQACSALLRQWQLAPLNRHRQAVQSKTASTGQWLNNEYATFQRQSKQLNAQVWWLGTKVLPTGEVQLYAHNLRGLCHWQLLPGSPDSTDYTGFLSALAAHIKKPLALVLPSQRLLQDALVQQWLQQATAIAIADNSARQHSTTVTQTHGANSDTEVTMKSTKRTQSANKQCGLTHLQRLESESIHILREVVAESNNPVMLYSAGKDSSVMLHLAMKAFYPAQPPFPLLHIDTGWEFQAMYEFRDRMVKESGFELLTHSNPDGIEKGVNPFTHGAALYTDIMKTEALKQALDKYEFDAAFAGARRDEEKSRAKERVFSVRSSQHRWDPKNQRPEPWALYNTRTRPDQSLRVYPLSNWTEQDIWHYIYLHDIPIVTLYSAAERPVVERDGNLIVVNDERMPLKDFEVPMMRKVRFRTLSCYPLSSAIESEATTLPDIIQEMLLSKQSERRGQNNFNNSTSSMEKKKQEGYF